MCVLSNFDEKPYISINIKETPTITFFVMKNL